jgi:hypothetical protein
MPRSDFIPNPDDAFDTWFAAYQQYVAANFAALGLTPAEALDVQTAKINWSLGYSNVVVTKNAYQAAVETKDEKRADAEVVIRKITGKIQARPETTDPQRQGLGITVPDRIPTPLDPEKILLHPAPLHLVKPGRGQAELHFGPDPANENSNALPSICRAVRIFRAQGGVPADASAWVFIAEIAHSPWVDVLGNSAPITVSYRFQYVDRLGRPGQFSDPVTVAISA